MALLASALLPLPFLLPHGHRPTAPDTSPELVKLLRLLPLSVPISEVQQPAAPSAPAAAAAPRSALDRRVSDARPVPRPAVGLAITVPITPSAPPDTAGDPTSTARQAPAAQTVPPTTPQAPTLRLDDTVMRIAARAALNPLRSGDGPRLIEPEALSAADRLGTEVAETAKPDCVRPGASLLSLPRVLLEAITDRCR